jgi:hypothetical protein
VGDMTGEQGWEDKVGKTRLGRQGWEEKTGREGRYEKVGDGKEQNLENVAFS